MVLSGGQMTVLFVSDDLEFSVMTKRILEKRHNMRVQLESESDNVLKRLDRGHIDCIVSEFSLGNDTGLNLLNTVRNQHPNFPFILYAQEGSEGIAETAISHGVTEYIDRYASEDESREILARKISDAVGDVQDENWRKRASRRQNIALILSVLSIVLGSLSVAISVGYI
ncbi:response regulator [Halomicroarcula sp. F28]|uniref:response regulator n=1 Tax=Haloarcula salinisoli TaxID=2487746 RepID=UPI001C72FC1D|nr:response regulator [Halomicroarcula salinisoli]MBX0284738.1 response regulator [Halomicroarcula salinisoli]